MTFRRLALVSILALAVTFAACGGGSSSSSTAPAVSLAFTPGSTPPTSPMNIISPQNAAPLAVTISNGPANATVNWTVTCASAQCGSFSSTSTASGVQTTYTAPTVVPSGGTVTVTATSANNSSVFISARITIDSTIVLTFTSGSAPPINPLNIVAPGNTANLAVTIANAPANATVNWSASCGSGPCGAFSSTSTASGVQTTYTAPTTVPGGGTVTVTATSANDSSKSLPGNISITSTIVVTFVAAPPSSMLIDGNTNLAVNLTNDTQNQGVTWSCAPSSLCGSFTPTATLNGVNTSFASPTAVPSGNKVTVTATSVSDYSKSASAQITITSNIVVNFTNGYTAPSSMNTNTQAQVAATTGSSDPSNAGVTWSASCGSAGACGTFNPATTANNVPTLYTAPLNVPAGTTVTITASAVSDFNKSALSNPVTIMQTAATLPDGTYVYQLTGEDSNSESGDSPFNVTGAFTIQSGEIIGGEQDFVDSTFAGQDAIIRGGSTTIVTTTDGNLQIVFDTGDTSIGTGASGLETMNVALTSSTTGFVTWFDGFASASGTLALQNSAAALSLPQNGYAFITSGYDSTLQSVVFGGILNVDDLNSTTGTISGAGSIFDINNWGNIQQGQAFLASTVLGPNSAPDAPDSYGRVTFTLNPNAASRIGQLQLAGYIIDSNTIALVETGDGFGGVTGGTALAQGSANTGKITNTNLSGHTYVVADQGSDVAFFLNFAGALSFAANGSVTGTADFQDTYSRLTGGISAPASSYQVEANGRVTISNLILNSGRGTYGPMTIQFYIDGNGNALTATMDSTDVLAGPAYSQTSGSTVTGTYALGASGYSAASSSPSGWSAAGMIDISSGAVQTGSFTDFNSFETSLSTDLGLRGIASGTTGNIVGFGALTASQADTFDFYPIDDFHAIGIETDAIQTALLYFAGTNPCDSATGKRVSCNDSKVVKTK